MGKMLFLMSFSDSSWNFRSKMCLLDKFYEIFHLVPEFSKGRVPWENLNFHKEIYENFIVWKLDFSGKIGKMSGGCVGIDQKLCKMIFTKFLIIPDTSPAYFPTFSLKISFLPYMVLFWRPIFDLYKHWLYWAPRDTQK